MKFVRDQRFYWSEPFAFARARARSFPQSGSKLPTFVILTLLFTAGMAFASPPTDRLDYVVLATFSVGLAFLISFPGQWLSSRLPMTVLVASNRVVTGNVAIKFSDIQSAVVGTMPIDGVTYPVFTFQTKDGRQYLCGLSHKVKAQELEDFLHQVGLHEPAA